MGRRIGRPRPLRPRARRYSWIEVVRRPVRQERRLPERCTPSTRTRGVRSLEFDVIGNLDADISFGPKHFEFLLARLAQDPTQGRRRRGHRRRLGLHAGQLRGRRGRCTGVPLFPHRPRLRTSAVIPASSRRIDWIAVTTARMKGWKTRNFPEHRFASSHYGHCRARVAGRDV